MKKDDAKENVKQATKDQQTASTEMAEQTMKNCDQVFRTGLKLQEEAMRWWSGVFQQTTLRTDWPKKMMDMTSMANGIMPAAQKRMEEMLDLMESNSRSGAELWNKAVDAAQTPAIAQSQSKWMDCWTSSLNAIRSNAEAVTNLQVRAIESWIDFVNKNTDVTEVRIPKTA